MRDDLGNLNRAFHGAEPEREIFVVDDNEDARDILSSLLSLEGLPVRGFASGDEFLRDGHTRVPICVFLDVVMPGRSGLEILKDLQTRRYRAPVILISSQDDPPTVVEAIKSGAHDFISKPFEPLAVVKKVREAVDFWINRESQRNVLELRSRDFPDYVYLAPEEQEALALTRLMANLR